MGLVQVFRRLLSWGWRWGGHPLVLLIATVLIIAQTAYLVRHEIEPGNTSGSRRTKAIWEDARFSGVRNVGWYVNQKYPETPLYQPFEGLPNEQFDFAWDLDQKEYFAAPRDHLGNRGAKLGSVSVVHPRARVRTGVWAPTRLQCAMRYSLLYLNEFERELAYELLSEAYSEHGSERHLSVSAAIRNQERIVTVTLYSGYAHNAAAVLFLGVMLRGTMGLLQRIRKRLRVTRHRCVACGYNLFGLTRGRCPECGGDRTD